MVDCARRAARARDKISSVVTPCSAAISRKRWIVSGDAEIELGVNVGSSVQASSLASLSSDSCWLIGVRGAGGDISCPVKDAFHTGHGWDGDWHHAQYSYFAAGAIIIT